MKNMYYSVGWTEPAKIMGWHSVAEAMEYKPVTSHVVGHIVEMTPDVIIMAGVDCYGTEHSYGHIARIPMAMVTEMLPLVDGGPQPYAKVMEDYATYMAEGI